MKKNTQKKPRLLVIAILIVSALLLVNLLLLAILLDKRVGTSGADDNYIGETQQVALPSARVSCLRASGAPLGLLSSRTSTAQEKLSLSLWNGYSGEKAFSVTNMLPGDSATKEYAVAVRSKDALALTFDINVKQNSLLADALVLTVVANGEPLYSAPLSQMPPLTVALKRGVASQEVVYKITASLPTSADNTVARLSLSVDFLWKLTENEPSSPGHAWPVLPETTETEPPETTETDPPETEPDPPVTTETEPPETEPDPPVTEPDPPETTPDPPVITHDKCKVCIIDKLLERLIGKHDERCIICDTIEAIFAVDRDICICEIGCFLVLLLIVLLILLIILTVLYFIFKRRSEEEEEEEDAQTPPEDPTENGSDDQL